MKTLEYQQEALDIRKKKLEQKDMKKWSAQIGSTGAYLLSSSKNDRIDSRLLSSIIIIGPLE